jgi:hypothetical protein
LGRGGDERLVGNLLSDVAPSVIAMRIARAIGTVGDHSDEKDRECHHNEKA